MINPIAWTTLQVDTQAHPSQTMFILNCPGLPFSIAWDYNHYYLIFSRSFYGHCPTRIYAELNPTTAGDEPQHLPNGHPCIWLEPRNPRQPNKAGPEEVEELIPMLGVSGPRQVPIRLTGRRKRLSRADGRGQPTEAVEIVLMLNEDELAHCCYYCGMPES
ncbi:hypothetical protein FB451DRAFT_1093028 [Mycena latifolia]|nr:hypothetical protein FB451DRAFT_1093028 [Mycena latifolia]